MKRILRFTVLAGLLGTSGQAWPASGAYPESPKGVMERYLALDAEAAGLSTATWPELGQYTTFPQAPKWDTFVIIDSFEAGKAMEGHSRAQVRVIYHPLGIMADKFTQDTKPENVVFYLVKDHGQWKVDSPPLIPHVSFDVMKKRLDTSSAANPKEKKANDALVAQIAAARGH